MKRITAIFFVLVLSCGIVSAIDIELPQSFKQQLQSQRADSSKLDFMTDYLQNNFIKSKTISDTVALEIATRAEKLISKNTTKKRQYALYNLLYNIHTSLKNNGRAASYKKKAVTLNLELGDLQQKEIENQKNLLDEKTQTINQKEQTIQQQKGSLNKLGKENKEKSEKITETEKQLYLEKIVRENKDAELKTMQQEKEIQQLELQKKETLNTIYFLLAALFVCITAAVVFMYLNGRKISRKQTEQNILLTKEKKRSDELLLNILPHELAEELKQSGKSEARSHEAVTVMFTDFKDFSKISELLTPQELVHEIDFCFKQFDLITQKYGIEKIKTIGDSYLCASGIPAADEKHAVNMIRAALDIRNFMRELKEERSRAGQIAFELRIGIHSGPLVAGIVGIKKFAYDIWGDTVNIASRMESSGQAGKINVSESTYQLTKDNFYFIHRGKIDAKNKGLIDMYFVEELT